MTEIVVLISISIVLLLAYHIKTIRVYQKIHKKMSTKIQEQRKTIHEQQEFADVLSTELRTPLLGILGVSGVLSEEYEVLRNDPSLQSLRFTSNYLLSLTANIRQAYALDEADITATHTVFDIRKTIEHISNSFAYIANSNSGKYTLHFDTTIADYCVGDVHVLSQIIMNLMYNAFRFTEDGTIALKVQQVKATEHTQTLEVSVFCDGSPLTKEEERSIYQEFRHEMTSYQNTSSDMQLEIVEKLATSIDAIVTTENVDENGTLTTLRVTYPLSDISPETLQSHAFATGSPHILIVDDNKLSRMLAKRILETEDYTCALATNGHEAIAMCEDESYDLILMDVNMPGINGIGTTKQIRDFDNDTPIVALTAVDITQLNQQLINAGFNGYLLKPYDKNQLIEIVEKHVRSRMNDSVIMTAS